MGHPIPPPTGGPSRFNADPVRVMWVIFTVLQGANSLLLLLWEAWTATIGGGVAAFLTVVYGAVSELFVRPATVPRAPLDELARQQDH